MILKIQILSLVMKYQELELLKIQSIWIIILLSLSKASAVYALRLTGAGYSSATFTPDSLIEQTVGTGVTAVGKVLGYDQVTGVLKYWQDRTMAGFNTVGVGKLTPVMGII